MKQVFYKKVGRRYEPVAEYDSELMDSFPKGCHLVVCQPGSQSRRFSIDPDYATLVAASHVAKEKIVDALLAKSTAEIYNTTGKKRELTEEQRQAWEHLVEVMGDDARRLSYASANDVADAGVKAMIEEAKKLLKKPSVQVAWDQFMMVVKLAEDN